MAKKVVGYVRVSSKHQQREGYSIEAQRRQIEDYARLKGWEILRIYEDAGISGKSIEGRRAFQELLHHAQKGEFKAILIVKFDRAFRNVKDALETLDALNQIDVDFVSISEQIDTTTAMGRLFFTIISSFAQFERELTSERLNGVYVEKFSQGIMVGKAPLGFRWNKAKRVMEIDARKAAVVRDVFAMTVAGHTYREICTKHRLKPQSYYNMVRNRVYIGEIAFGGETRKGAHEALLDQAVFEHANELLARKREEVAA